MKTIVNIHAAKTNLSKLLDRARKGEEIVIAKAGKPYARLVRVEDSKPRQPGLVKGRLPDSFFEPLPEDELQAWYK